MSILSDLKILDMFIRHWFYTSFDILMSFQSLSILSTYPDTTYRIHLILHDIFETTL